MKKRPAVVLGCLLIAVSGAAAFATVSLRTQISPQSRIEPQNEPSWWGCSPSLSCVGRHKRAPVTCTLSGVSAIAVPLS